MTAAKYLAITADSDRATYDACMAIARECLNPEEPHEEVTNGTWTDEQAAIFHAADGLKDHFETLLDDMHFPGEDSKSCIAATLMASALGDIDWNELAEHYLDKIAEQARS